MKYHLDSMVHKPVANIRCPRCQSVFRSLSAAISHCETYSKRCKIRSGEELSRFVHQMTGGLLTIDLHQAKAKPQELREIVVSEDFRDSLHGRKKKFGISFEDGEDFMGDIGSEAGAW